jgi:ankyrin repeat protein
MIYNYDDPTIIPDFLAVTVPNYYTYYTTTYECIIYEIIAIFVEKCFYEKSVEGLSTMLPYDTTFINAQGPSCQTIFISAAIGRQWSIMEELLKYKYININHQDKHGGTALSWVCSEKNLEMLRLLMKHNVDLNCVDPTTGYTPLFRACFENYGCDEIAIELLKHPKVNVHYICSLGTPFMQACKRNSLPVIEQFFLILKMQLVGHD